MTPRAARRVTVDRSEQWCRGAETVPRARLNAVLGGLFLFLTVGTMAARAQAEPAAQALPLTLEDALHRAYDGGEEIRLAEVGVSVAEEGLRSARSFLLPRLDLGVRYTRALNSAITTDNTWAVGLTLFQPLYTGGMLTSSVTVGELMLDNAEQQAVEVRDDLTLNVTVAYFDAVLAARLEAIVEAQVRQVTEELEWVTLREEVGNAARIDVLRAQVDLANLEPDLVSARNAHTGALLDLRRLINLDEQAPIRLVDSLTPDGFRAVSEDQLDQWATAARLRPVLEIARRQVDVERQRVAIARATFRPRASLSASFAEEAVPTEVVPGLDDFFEDWTAGVVFSLPVFTGGERRATIGIAEHQVSQAELQLRQLEESIAVQVQLARAEITRAITLIEARAETVEQAIEVYRLSKLRFEQGQTTFLELGDAQLVLRQARANEAQAMHDYFLALARFLRAAGIPRAVSTVQSAQTSPSATIGDGSASRSERPLPLTQPAVTQPAVTGGAETGGAEHQS